MSAYGGDQLGAYKEPYKLTYSSKTYSKVVKPGTADLTKEKLLCQNKLKDFCPLVCNIQKN